MKLRSFKSIVLSIGFLGSFFTGATFAASEEANTANPSVKVLLRKGFSTESEVDAQIVEDLKSTGEFKKTSENENEKQNELKDNSISKKHQKRLSEKLKAQNKALQEGQNKLSEKEDSASGISHSERRLEPELNTRAASEPVPAKVKPSEKKTTSSEIFHSNMNSKKNSENNVNTSTNEDVNAAKTIPVANAISNDLEVLEFVLAKNVAGREPQEIVENYANDEKAYAFARIEVRQPSQVTFVWSHDGHVHNRFTTNLQPSKKFRTYAATKIKPGHWKVQLMLGDHVLSEKDFTVE